MFEVLFQILGEFVLQLIGEALLEIGFHTLTQPFRKLADPWVAALGYAMLGAIIGGLSLLIFPLHLTPAGFARILNVALTPIAVGLCMSALGMWRASRGEPVLRIDRFSYGYLFALAFALVRFRFAC